MLYAILGIILGVLIGIAAPLTIPVEFARYTAVGIIGILDSILGAAKADLQGQYQSSIFISGLLTNMALAIAITFIGDRIGIDLYLAVLVAFTIRMLANLGVIRYSFLTRFLGKRKVEEKIQEKNPE